MITAMRDYARGLKFVLLIVIAIFILTSGVLLYFGTAPLGGGTGTGVAVVNGEEIPYARFRRAQANFMAEYERMARQRLTAEMAERLGLTQQVLNELVLDVVVVQGAAREGVRVTDEEVRATVQQIREFHEGGRFSRDEYLRVLRRLRLDPGEFEGEVRRHLLRRKMEALIKEGVKVSEGEIRQAYEQRHERVRAAWASAEIRPVMAQVQVVDADLESYVKSHPAQFSQPERRRLQYVVLSPKRFAQAVSDADALAYYKEHGAEFEASRRLRVAHVLVRVPPVGGSEAENAAKAKAEDVIRRATTGEDFAKLARELSEDKANAAQGGDLGFVGPGELVAPFEQAAFALKKGEISPAPVRTPFGYHAIRVLDVREGGKAPFKDVEAKIKETLAAQRSERAAQAKADEVKPALQTAKDFAAEAGRLGLDVRTAAFGRGDTLEDAGRDAQIDDAIFGLAVGGVSAPLKTSGGYAVVKVVQQVPAGVPPLADIKERVIEAVKRERAERQLTEKAKGLIAALDKGDDFAAAARAGGFTPGVLPLFSRSEPPKDRGGLPGSVLLAALQTPAGQAAEPIRTDGGVYIVKTLERQPAGSAGFEKERGDLEKQVLEQKRGLAWDEWVRGRLAAGKVEVGGQPFTPTR